MQVKSQSPVLQILGDQETYLKKVTEQYSKRLELQKESIEQNNAKFEALVTLKNLVQNYTRAASSLSDPVSNPFLNKDTVITTSENIGTGNNYIEVMAQAKASTGSFDVRVEQVAKASRMVLSTPPWFSYDSAQPGGGEVRLGGTLKITVGDQDKIIALSETDDFAAIISKINEAFKTDNIKAEAIPIISRNRAYIEIRALESGATNLNATWDQPEGGDHGFFNPAPQITIGNGAIIRVNGIEIRQNSNIFEEVMPGITIKALAPNNQADATKAQTVTVVHDKDKTIGELAKFASAYNELSKFVAKMTEKSSDSEYAKTAVLWDTEEIRQAKNLLDAFGSGTTASGKYTSLEQIGLGITVSSDSSMSPGTKIFETRDPLKLGDAINNYFDDFTKLFRGGATITRAIGNQGSTLAYSTSFKLLSDRVLNRDINFSITLGLVAGTVDQVNVTIPEQNGEAAINTTGIYRVQGGSGFITFADDSPLAGLSLSYDPKNLAGVTENFTVNLHQGLADIAYFKSSDLVSSNGLSGRVLGAISQKGEAAKKLVQEQERIEAQIASKKQQVSESFSRISTMEYLNQFLADAIMDFLNPQN